VRSAAGLTGNGLIAPFDTGRSGDYALLAIRRVIGAPAGFLLHSRAGRATAASA